MVYLKYTLSYHKKETILFTPDPFLWYTSKKESLNKNPGFFGGTQPVLRAYVTQISLPNMVCALDASPPLRAVFFFLFVFKV